MQKTSALSKKGKIAQSGGLATKEKYGNVHFKKLALDRWAKRKKK